MRTEFEYIFFYEGKESLPEFSIVARDHVVARQIAYDYYGPQVDDLLCKIKQ